MSSIVEFFVWICLEVFIFVIILCLFEWLFVQGASGTELSQRSSRTHVSANKCQYTHSYSLRFLHASDNVLINSCTVKVRLVDDAFLRISSQVPLANERTYLSWSEILLLCLCILIFCAVYLYIFIFKCIVVVSIINMSLEQGWLATSQESRNTITVDLTDSIWWVVNITFILKIAERTVAT